MNLTSVYFCNFAKHKKDPGLDWLQFLELNYGLEFWRTYAVQMSGLTSMTWDMKGSFCIFEKFEHKIMNLKNLGMGLKMALQKLKDSSLWMMTSYDNLICQF